MRIRITGLGSYLPPRIETAADLSPRVGRSVDWIVSRTGVRERHVSDGESMAQMGAKAAREALGDGPPPDLVLNCSLTPMQLIPDSSVFLLDALGLSGTPSFSIHATCLSFLVGLHTAGSLVHSGAYRRVLLVSSEQGSVSRDYDHPESAVLIGDGAGAAIVEAAPADSGSALLAYRMTTWPEGSDLAELRGCGTRAHPNDPATTPADNLFRMRGPRIYKMAVNKVEALFDALFEETGLTPDDVALVVPHQTSGPGNKTIQRFGFPEDRIIDIVGTTGNCIAASLPMALAHAHRTGRLNRGDLILLAGTGAGLSVAGALVRW